MENESFSVSKSTLKKVGIAALVLLVAAWFFFPGNGSQGAVVADITEPADLSGKIVGMDPNRQMAGAPCHVMGGRVMGDCQTREVQLTAFRYDWSEPTITVRKGELVRIVATSTDVAHGLAIPDLGFNLKIEPGKTTTGEFMAPAPGVYQYGCSVMCGPGHHGHTGTLVVVA